MHQYFVYIITNKNNTVLYIGVTNNLVRRIYQHKNKTISSFSSKYNLNKLVYYEVFPRIELAIEREKQLKAGSRAKKNLLIQSINPNSEDLYSQICS
ncbi:GIY-YIG nuclease [Candidatus Roizmanbacteria bacterium CG17_big_fil_post_rev_8_21_14_2_50_39_7]|uniref:GIY-YIG nuclease n=1 Tax=Candidatus Roizmanbacteria bacterium CG17_big_fil_post_rev_8_21_14_2_50_39_7 TaxID=1974858 RepID=A0A2M7EJU9_9BACT|nr:MAG: GIY-YIG nuclease [Candidatus Roizmanbacteria bacterium CG17_big_fil_post_rev_8_21_14_2_50_39_7]